MSGSEVGWGLKATQKLFVRYFITRRDGSEAQERIGASFGTVSRSNPYLLCHW